MVSLNVISSFIICTIWKVSIWVCCAKHILSEWHVTAAFNRRYWTWNISDPWFLFLEITWHPWWDQPVSWKPVDEVERAINDKVRPILKYRSTPDALELIRAQNMKWKLISDRFAMLYRQQHFKIKSNSSTRETQHNVMYKGLYIYNKWYIADQKCIFKTIVYS